MNINEIENHDEFEYSGDTLDGKVDFVITIADNKFITHYFNKNVTNSDDAFIGSLYCESNVLEEAIENSKNYILD